MFAKLEQGRELPVQLDNTSPQGRHVLPLQMVNLRRVRAQKLIAPSVTFQLQLRTMLRVLQQLPVVSQPQPELRLLRKLKLENGLFRATFQNEIVNWETPAMELAIRSRVLKETNVRWDHLQKLLLPPEIFTTKPVCGTQRNVHQASSVLRQLVRLLKTSRMVTGQLKERVLARQTNVRLVTNVKSQLVQLAPTKRLVPQVNTQELTPRLVALLPLAATEMFVTNLRKTSVQTDSTATWTALMQSQATLTPNNARSEPTTLLRLLAPPQLKTVSNVKQVKPVWSKDLNRIQQIVGQVISV